ncbi:MAG: SpaA isopeptide-forming pilin-related protein [Acutalibacteraceae bacterium]|nr:SpaA isopeptide-forming pilin-related protein [Acutalibacteraceae bacterium]
MKNFKRIVSLILAFVMLICMTPLTIFAAPASDIPADMLDNVYLDALEYTGYKVQTQKNDGTIFKKYSNSAPASVRSNISYGTGPSGLETVSNSGTATGLAPNIAKFEQSGLCCASYVSYVYYNYLPNIAGIDTSGTPAPSNPRAAVAYKNAAESWISSGIARSIPFAQNSDGSGFSSTETIPIGSLIAFKNISSGTIAHVAIYAGYYNGNHFITHVGNDNGPEFCTISGMSKGGSPQVVALISAPEFVEANGAIEVYKKDTDGNNLSGAVFVATNDTTGTQYKIGPTNANGYAISDDALPFGTYTVKETVFPANYKSYGTTEWKVTVNSNNNGVVRINAVNEIVKGNIEIIKTSEDGIVDGISFRITGNGIDKTVATSNGGKITVKDLKPGTYTVTESIKEYYVSQEAKTVTVVSGRTATVTFNNTLKRGNIEILKTGEVFWSVEEKDGVFKPIYKESGLDGAVFSITAAEDIVSPDGVLLCEKGTPVDTVTTDSKGIGRTVPLHFGKYEIREIKAPYGMIKNNDVYIAEIIFGKNETVHITSVSVINKRQKAEISLSKILEKDADFGIGENGEILKVQFGIFAAADLEAKDGSIIPTDALIETAYCDEDGNITFKTDIPVGAKLYIKEIATDDRYIISDEKYFVEFGYQGEDVTTVLLSVLGGQKIENDLKRGTVIGYKVDEDGFTIEGAVFGLFKPDEKEFSEDTAIMTATSNEIGVFGFENVPYGNWILREIKAAPAFVLNTENYAVNITKHEQVVEIIIENRFIVGSVQVTKTDADYPENKLTGAEFEVYVDVDRNKEYDPEIDLLVDELTETEKGIYRLENLRYNGYFLYEKSAPEGFIKDDGYYYFEIRNDGEIVNVETEAVKGFINKPIKGELVILKTDKHTGKVIEGVGFRVKDAEGNVVAEDYTNAEGIVKFTLRYGKYTYEEFKTPYDYKTNNTVYECEITENGMMVYAEVKNERIDVPTAPKTGDNSKIGFWLGLAAVALGGLISCAIIMFKNKNGNYDDDED